MTRERFAPMSGIDRDGVCLATSGDSRAKATGAVIYLPIEPAPGLSPRQETGRQGNLMRPYVEALVGWLLIFGMAYLALLLIGG